MKDNFHKFQPLPHEEDICYICGKGKSEHGDNMKQTPEQIINKYEEKVIEKVKAWMEHTDNWNDMRDSLVLEKAKVLSALKEYYTLSDVELIELLPKKKEILEKDQDLWEHEDFEQDKVNKIIDICFQSLRGRVQKKINIEEMAKILWNMDTKMLCNGVNNNKKEYWINLAQAIKDKETE